MPTHEPPAEESQKLAPNSQESEEAVLGSILINPEAWTEDVYARLRDGRPFYYEHHRYVYQALLAINERKEDIDAVTVVEELRQRRDRDGQTYLNKMGGSAFITSLINNTPTHVHIETYAAIIERLWIRRELLNAASDIAKAALTDDIELEEVLAKANRALQAVETPTEDDEVTTIGEAAEGRFEYLIAVRDGVIENRVISTGFSAIDSMLADGGFAPGNLNFVIGRPGMGKSALLAALIMAALLRRRKVFLATLEMSSWQIVDRMMAAVSKLNSKKIKQIDMNASEWERLADAKEALKDYPLWLKDKPGQTLSQIKRAVRKLVKRYGVEMLVIDYLQIMGTGDVKTGNRTQDIGLITSQLKALAKELDIVIIVAAQINRESEQGSDHRPKLHHMRESDSIASDADVVLAPYREEYHDPSKKSQNMINSTMSKMEIGVLKARDGETGAVPALFNATTVQVLPAISESRDFSQWAERGVVVIDGAEIPF